MGGFFGMLKENKYIQRGWEFNPKEELKKSQTNSCADSTSLWSGRFSTICSVTLRVITRLFGRFPGLFCGAARAEPDWAQSQNTLIQALLPREEGKSLWQVTPTPAVPTRLCFCFCSLSGRLFLPFSCQPLNIFPLWPLQNTPSHPREL